MFDRLVADSDHTSTGGRVYVSSPSFNEEGRVHARSGNRATCGNCKDAWEIYGAAGGWMDEGRSMVKGFDRVMCPCGRNVAFAASSSNAFYSDSVIRATPALSPQAPVYDQQFRLKMTAVHRLQMCTTG